MATLNAYDAERVRELETARAYLLRMIAKAEDEFSSWDLICNMSFDGRDGGMDYSGLVHVDNDVVVSILRAQVTDVEAHIRHYGGAI